MPKIDVPARAVNGTIDTPLLDTFKKSISGDVLLKGDDLYGATKMIWNKMIDRDPYVIVKCTNRDDVIASVNFARENNLIISIKGGGHNVAGNAVCQDGLMIDLSLMKKINVDVEKQVAFAEPGILWKELDKATLAHNLATTGGTVSDTGIAGLTLGGGVGWLMGKHGTTCDNLLSAEIITAAGACLKVDKDNHPDLFWAIRGGGGNFGIITGFEYQLHTVEPYVMGGMLLYPMEEAKEVFRFYRDFVRNAPDELMSYAGFMVTPDGMPVTMLMPAWMGPLEDAEKNLAPLRNFITPMADLIARMHYGELQSILDDAAPSGLRRYWKSGYFTELSDELIDIILKNLETVPSPLSPVLFYHMHGKAARVDPAATAFGNRKDQWDGSIISQWLESGNDEENILWTRTFWKEMEPLTKGVYVNHLDSDDGRDRVKNAYGQIINGWLLSKSSMIRKIFSG